MAAMAKAAIKNPSEALSLRPTNGEAGVILAMKPLFVGHSLPGNNSKL